MKIQDIINDKKKMYSFYVPEEYGRDFPRIPTGIFAWDLIVGSGVPVGVTSSIYGPEGGGKSTIITYLLSSAQNICWNCFEYLWDCQCDQQTKKKAVIVQTERFDLDWAEKFGVDVDELVLAEPCSGEEAVDIIYECIQAEDCGLVALDSFSRVVPETEITEPALSNHVGTRAKLHTKLINKVKSALINNKRKGQNTAFVATNQMRAKIGNTWGGATDEPTGCFASKHDWHLSCRMSQLKSPYTDKETELPTYGKFKASIISPGIKRKLLTLGGTAEFYIAMQDTASHSTGQVFDEKTTFDYADNAGLIDRNSWKFLGTEYGTKTALMQHWQENPQAFLTAKKRIIEHYAKLKKGKTDEV